VNVSDEISTSLEFNYFVLSDCMFVTVSLNSFNVMKNNFVNCIRRKKEEIDIVNAC